MECKGCHHNTGIQGNMVACSSVKHAKFMDIQGNTRHQKMISKLEAMPLVTIESCGVGCDEFINEKDWLEQSKQNRKWRK